MFEVIHKLARYYLPNRCSTLVSKQFYSRVDISLVIETSLGSYLEEELIYAIEGILRNLGMEVYTNVLVDRLELDLVAIENASARPLIYIVEVKSRPKHKLLSQVLSRVGLSDYVYAALPVKHYLYLLEVPEPVGSLAVDVDGQIIYEIKKPTYVGNGWKLLEVLRSRPLRIG